MSIGASIFLAAVGAILYFAVNASISGLDISTIGIILMIAGLVGLVLSLLAQSRRSKSSVITQDSAGRVSRTEAETDTRTPLQ